MAGDEERLIKAVPVTWLLTLPPYLACVAAWLSILGFERLVRFCRGALDRRS